MHANDDSLPIEAAALPIRLPQSNLPESGEPNPLVDLPLNAERAPEVSSASSTGSGALIDPEEAAFSEILVGAKTPASWESEAAAATRDLDQAWQARGQTQPASDVPSENQSLASDAPPHQLAYSTLLSLMVVSILIITIRFTVPPLVESLRYSWYRGQLRAEYEVSGQRLQNVSLNSLSDASELVSRRVGPSVVHINLLEVFEAPKRAFLGANNERVQMVGQGSGVILDIHGHILTNQHVIDGAGRIEVSLSDGRRVIAEPIGIDPLTDLAVIKVDADGLMPVEWGDSNRVDVGSPVWAVGSPFGLERTVTFGILSGKHRIDLKGTRWDARSRTSTTYGDLMQSDVAVNPGNSGGPLVNSSGEIIGINTAILGETYTGISFSIPSNVAKRVAQGLIEEGEVERGWLGVALKDPVVEEDAAGRLSPRGALVIAWAETGHSPAKAAGIRPGDIIVKFGDEEVTSHRSLMGLVAQTDVGVSIPVEVMREGQLLIFNVEIGRRLQQPSDSKR